MLRNDTKATAYLNGYMFEQKELDFSTLLQTVTTEFTPLDKKSFDPYTKSNRGVEGDWTGYNLPGTELGVVHIANAVPNEQKLVLIDFSDNSVFVIKHKEGREPEIISNSLDEDKDSMMALLDRSFPKPKAKTLVA